MKAKAKYGATLDKLTCAEQTARHEKAHKALEKFYSEHRDMPFDVWVGRDGVKFFLVQIHHVTFRFAGRNYPRLDEHKRNGPFPTPEAAYIFWKLTQ